MIPKKSKYPGRTDQDGLSLIELMIAMLLGLLLMGAIVQIFVSSKRSYYVQEAQSRVQENGRLAMYFLPYDIRRADFQGCLSRQKYTTTHVIADATVACPARRKCAPDLDHSLFDLYGGITGSDNVPSATLVGGKNVAPGTDIVNIQFAESCRGYLQENMDTRDANIQIDGDNTCKLKKHWPYLISDCLDTDIFRAEPVSKQKHDKETVAHPESSNRSNSLSKAYRKNAEIYAIQSLTYFIAQNPIGNNALFRRNHYTGLTEEIVEGVEDMQILYGEDSDQDDTANYYVNAATVGAMQNVVSIKVSLLLRSLSDVNVTSEPIIYTYSGVTYNDGAPAPRLDNQMRKVFSSTVTLRNRLP